MKSIMVQSMTSNLARTAKVRLGDSVQVNSDEVSCVGHILVTETAMQQDYNNGLLSRPYIKLIGEVNTIEGDFPHDVGEVTYDARHKPFVEYRYELTDEELADLCTKGLFVEGFDCPDVFRNNEFELPLTCSVVSIAPTEEEDVPLLFVSVNDQYNLKTSSALSGYTITDYFEKPKLVRKTAEVEKVAELSEEEKQDFEEIELNAQASESEVTYESEPDAEVSELSYDEGELENDDAEHVVDEELSDVDESMEDEQTEEEQCQELFNSMVNNEPAAWHTQPTQKVVPDAHLEVDEIDGTEYGE